MDREKLLIKIEQTKEKLYKYEIMLDKITPHKPSVYEHMDWNGKTKQMDKSYECNYVKELRNINVDIWSIGILRRINCVRWNQCIEYNCDT